MSSCVEAFGSKVEGTISKFFQAIGGYVGHKPWRTIFACILLTVLCGIGFMRWETENRSEELWVPQDTIAEEETFKYQSYFPSSARFNSIIVQDVSVGTNVLTKTALEDAMRMHEEIQTKKAKNVEGEEYEGEEYDFLDLCVKAGGSCASSQGGICQCLVTSILRQWNYDLATLQNDTDVLSTINSYGSKEDLEAVLGSPTFDEDGQVVSAQAFTLAYFLEDRSEVVDGSEVDPVNEAWEEQVFLATTQSVPTDYTKISVDYFATRSFADEFGGAITGDLFLVQISYVMAFLFLGATMGRIVCGVGSRWTLALGALVAVGLSTGAGFGVSSAFGLFFGPVHSLLPFILLGIGVDDAFVIVNAFNRERKVVRSAEDNESLAARSAKALARAGASITVTSLTDLVAFAISSSSKLPALASFCAYAAISIFFLWLFASTFFSATLVLDERRQRDNRRECLCCVTRKKPMAEEDEDDPFKEGFISKYFRNYHAPAILSPIGKGIVLTLFAGLLGFGVYGAMNLTVEDTEREFIPAGSYLNDYFEAADEYFPSKGIDLYITFEGSSDIYANRQELAELADRLSGKSEEAPFIAEPVSEEAYQNVMTGLYQYLVASGSGAIGNVTLGDDNWPTNEADFVLTITNYASFFGPGAQYSQDLALSEDGTALEAFKVKSEYVRLTKLSRGDIIDDADRQIEAMDATRDMIESWTDLQPSFPYSEKFITIEGFKIIQQELFQNVGLAILAVGIIVFITVASPVTALLITANVAFCIIEILGFMYALGIVIDSVSVINIVLAVGLSVDYSAHVGHCFMVKGGSDKNKRVTEALADIGAAVLSGAISTFLAVVVLLFSSSYVFKVLSRQFALTVLLGVLHGLVLLPVVMALLGPAPFSSAEDPEGEAVHSAAKKLDESSSSEDGENNQETTSEEDNGRPAVVKAESDDGSLET